MKDEDVFNTSKYVGLLDIAISVNFGLDPHFQVIWTQVVPHLSHTVIQLLAEIIFRTIQETEIMENDELFISIITPFVFKNGPELFGNGCSCVGIRNITCFNLKVIQIRNGE